MANVVRSAHSIHAEHVPAAAHELQKAQAAVLPRSPLPHPLSRPPPLQAESFKTNFLSPGALIH